ncbi:MAG: PilZ domain-containing protein [Thermodesulfobacteriota bacterium]
MKIKKERRHHHRFDSLGNIIAINTMNLGQVINLSMGGLRIEYLLRPNDLFEHSFSISLLNNTGDRYIDNLPCKIVSFEDSEPIFPSINSINLFTREAGVMFDDLTSSQIKQLSYFVVHTVLLNDRPTSY